MTDLNKPFPPKPFPRPTAPKKPTAPAVPHPNPPTQFHDAPKDIFIQHKWSNEGNGKAPLPNGQFTVEYSQVADFLNPKVSTPKQNSNHKQATEILSDNGVVLTVNAAQPPDWYKCPNEIEDQFIIKGVSYPYDHERADLGVLISAWAYPGILELLLQWDDVGDVDGHHGADAPDWDYNDNQCYIWLEIDPNYIIDCTPDDQNLVLHVIHKK